MAGKVIRKKSSKQILNGSRQRVTNQRELLLDLICQNYGHLDADELYQKARKKNHRLSLSTVYRNLHLFKKLGLVDEHHFTDEHHHYEVKPAAEHQHFFCLNCGKIVEITTPLNQQIKEQICRQHQVKITEIELHLRGLCAACSSTKKEVKPA